MFLTMNAINFNCSWLNGGWRKFLIQPCWWDLEPLRNERIKFYEDSSASVRSGDTEVVIVTNNLWSFEENKAIGNKSKCMVILWCKWSSTIFLHILFNLFHMPYRILVWASVSLKRIYLYDSWGLYRWKYSFMFIFWNSDSIDNFQ